MSVRHIISASWIDANESRSFGHLLRQHGVDLNTLDPEAFTLERGTPVYVHASADADTVERRMVIAHIRYLFVLDEERVLGVIDLADLVARAEEIAWPRDPRQRPAKRRLKGTTKLRRWWVRSVSS